MTTEEPELPFDKPPLVFQALTVRVREACRITGIGRSKMYQLMRSGDIATIKVGSITLIPMNSLEALLGLHTRPASTSVVAPPFQRGND